jgi:hypothetical protein
MSGEATMFKAILAGGIVWLALAAAPALAQPVSATTLPANPGTGGGYAGALTGPGSIGGNPEGIMGSPGTDGAFPIGPSGPRSLTGETLTATGSMDGMTGGYALTPGSRAVLSPNGLAVLLGLGGG